MAKPLENYTDVDNRCFLLYLVNAGIPSREGRGVFMHLPMKTLDKCVHKLRITHLKTI